MHDTECWFFTAHTRERWPTFRDPLSVRALIEAMRRVRERDAFESLALVVLPDHVHGLWSMARGDDAFARRWSALEAELGGIALDPPRTRRVDSEREQVALRAYIHFNPVRHGLVANAGAWPYSTLRVLARHLREHAA